MTVYEIIQQKEQQVERLTREIAALREAARMLENSRSDGEDTGRPEQAPTQFP
ncbi:MAG TPA: hypothetical protein VKW78_13020 [Terriglobales bacterium]|nr:hypothetical protein [Terriglobales bacterium]